MYFTYKYPSLSSGTPPKREVPSSQESTDFSRLGSPTATIRKEALILLPRKLNPQYQIPNPGLRTLYNLSYSPEEYVEDSDAVTQRDRNDQKTLDPLRAHGHPVHERRWFPKRWQLNCLSRHYLVSTYPGPCAKESGRRSGSMFRSRSA
jgi:hypothetical protein